MSSDEKNPGMPCGGHSRDHGGTATVTMPKTTSAAAEVARPGDKETAAKAIEPPGHDHCH